MQNKCQNTNKYSIKLVEVVTLVRVLWGSVSLNYGNSMINGWLLESTDIKFGIMSKFWSALPPSRTPPRFCQGSQLSQLILLSVCLLTIKEVIPFFRFFLLTLKGLDIPLDSGHGLNFRHHATLATERTQDFTNRESQEKTNSRRTTL